FDVHSAALVLKNTTGLSIGALTVTCKLYANHPQGRDATITWAGSSGTGNSTSETTDNILTTGTSTISTWLYVTKTLTITDLDIPNGSTYTLTWSSDRGTGSGSSDEWAVDDITVTAETFVPDPVIAVDPALLSFGNLSF